MSRFGRRNKLNKNEKAILQSLCDRYKKFTGQDAPQLFIKKWTEATLRKGEPIDLRV